jgi:hypothetical protein
VLPDACIAANKTRKPNSAMPAPMSESTTYFHAASNASRVFSNETSSAEQSVVNSTTIQTSVGSARTGMASMEKTNRL